MGTVTSLTAWRQRRAWEKTVRHLHSLGTPALVPACVAAGLNATGIPWDWYYRNPCGQHSGECMAAVPDDTTHGPSEFHLPVKPEEP
jgi:hypothetical protein